MVTVVAVALTADEPASTKSRPVGSKLRACTLVASSGPLFVSTTVIVTGWLVVGVRLLTLMFSDKSAPPAQMASGWLGALATAGLLATIRIR